MIETYVHKLIENLPQSITKKKTCMDLVLDGGLFNGSYLIGSLYFLNEMEKQNYIHIENISSCSIGSIVAILFYIKKMDHVTNIYDTALKYLKKHNNLNMFDILFHKIKLLIPKNICEIINGKIFISYYNVKKCKKVTISTFKNIPHLFQTIKRSCYIPFFIDGNIAENDKYIDGLYPYIFPYKKNKQILYLNLHSYDKITYLFTVKNEKNNFHRILSGLLDIHTFFIKETSTSMCSIVNEWTFIQRLNMKLFNYINDIFVIIIYLFIKLKKYFPKNMKNNIILKIIYKIIYEIYILWLHNYCF